MVDFGKIEGWKKEFRIPIANEENQRLQLHLENLMKQKNVARKNYEVVEERQIALKNHVKVVKKQNEENQRLITIYQQQCDLEENKAHNFTSEKQATLRDNRNMKKQTEEIINRQNNKRKNISATLAKIEKLKAELKWDKEALKAWEESLKSKNDDSELLMKFEKEDKRKINDLEIKRMNLQTDLNERQNVINKVAADVINSENILQRTGKVLKELKIEREALIKQWQEAVKNINRQDINIQNANLEAEVVEKAVAESSEKLNEQNKFLEDQKNNNKELENEIGEYNTRSSKMKRDLKTLTDNVLTLINEVDTLKHVLVSTANALRNERARKRNITQMISSKERKIEAMRNELINLKIKLKYVQNSNTTSAERALELEKMIEYEQKLTSALNQDIMRIQAQYYRTQQKLGEYQSDLKTKGVEISSSKARIILLKKECEKYADEVQNHKEHNYEIDFQISQLESRLNKLEGETNKHDDTGVQLENKYEELRNKLAKETEVKVMLQRQVVIVQEEMRRLNISLTADEKEMKKLKEKLQEQITLFEVGKKQVAAAGIMSRKKKVEENVLRLRVYQLEKTANKEDYKICDTKKYLIELEIAMRERLIELGSNKDIVSVKKRNLMDAKSRLKADISSRLIKVDQLKSKYHIAIMSLGKDDSGQPLSVTHFKIKKAQEKYQLQQEGDELDNIVKRSEKEIIALENTLKAVNSSNDVFKITVSAIDIQSSEFQEQKQLQNEIFDFNSVLQKNKRCLDKKMKSLEDMRNKIESIEMEKVDLKIEKENMEKKIIELQNMIAEFDKKIKKCEHRLQEVSVNLDHYKIDKYNKNLLIRFLQDANKCALRKLTELCVRFQEISSKVYCFLDNYNLGNYGTDISRISSVRDFESQASDSSRSYPSLNSKSSSEREEGKSYSVTSVTLTFDTQRCPKVCKCPEKRKILKSKKKN